jgi:parallel beta-helix repeat protein
VPLKRLAASVLPCLGPTKPALGLTDITDFGAVANDSVDDFSAIQSAINSIPSGGSGTIFVPPGTYKLGQRLQVLNKSIAFIGAGRGVSVLEFTGATDGIYCSFTSHYQRFTFRGISLLTSSPAGGTALKLDYPVGPGGVQSDPHLDDFHIGSTNDNTLSWQRGIEVSNAYGLKVTRFFINGCIGDRDNGNYTMDFGIILTNQSVVNHISEGMIWNANIGIGVFNSCEGVYFRSVEVVDANRGFYFDALAAGTKPGSVISGCHANTRIEGISVRGFTDLAIGDNLIYRLGTRPWVGIRTYKSKFSRIHSNYIISWNVAAGRNGIVLEDTQDCVVNGNIVRTTETGIWLANGSARNIVDGNRVISWSVSSILDDGIGNLVPAGTNLTT